MSNEAQTPKTFETAKTSIVLKPKTKPEMAMVYRGLQDLKSLILFVGSKPVLNADATIQYRKHIVKDNSVIFRNANGQVSKILSFEEASKVYEIIADSEFSQTHAFQAAPAAKK